LPVGTPKIKFTVQSSRFKVQRDKRQETRDKRQETRDKRQETRDKRQETRDKRQESRDKPQIQNSKSNESTIQPINNLTIHHSRLRQAQPPEYITPSLHHSITPPINQLTNRLPNTPLLHHSNTK
jgi:uncharacterized coiled-coil DUF342 family protein